jgi:ferric-dicitrate binding protein FerR (iron transport regulator)
MLRRMIHRLLHSTKDQFQVWDMARDSKRPGRFRKVLRIVFDVRDESILLLCKIRIPLPWVKATARWIAIPGGVWSALLLLSALHLLPISMPDAPPPQDSGPTMSVYSTAFGERRRLSLDDGTIVDLNSASSVEVYYSARVRWVELKNGEALFHVRHERRPFRVRCANSVVEDIATAFDVRMMDDGTQVFVTEGTVKLYPTVDLTMAHLLRDYSAIDKAKQGEIRTVLVHVGQQVELADDSGGSLHTLPPLSLSDIQRLTAWRDGEMHIFNEKLSQVLDDLKRYRPEEFKLADPALGERRLVGGSLHTADLEDFRIILRAQLNIRLSEPIEGRDGKTTFILSAGEPEQKGDSRLDQH